ncbi:MAG: class I SAM-dependent methyltransferase [Flavobacteriia bacterium]|nr:class I SAM-dependent methyltransferase [Flavobacteriia bacterium]
MQTNNKKTPWPTKEAMEQIYEKHLWGGKESEFYSGEGSHLDELVHPYVKVVTDFLTSFPTPITVCDLGCGDFNVGKELVKYTKHYIGVDIVEGLIAHNKEKFQTENLEFHCLDLAKDELPKGYCALVRQVLQHLSNQEIQSILHKLSDFKHLIITEHLPDGDFIPNLDIISGQGIRLKKNSGLNLLAPPFEWKMKEKVLLSINLSNKKGIVVTTLYSNY